MKQAILLLTCLISLNLAAQKVRNIEFPVQGALQIGNSLTIPKVANGYTLWYPEDSDVKGLIVFTRSRRDTVNSEPLIDYALSKQLAVLYATTENSVEFFFEMDSMREIESYIKEALNISKAPSENLLFCGMSLGGTRVLRLALYMQSKDSSYGLVPKAVAVCDAPLDMIRFHQEASKAARLNFHPAASGEGAWVSTYLEDNLGGKPAEAKERYIQYSPYCYQDGAGIHMDRLKQIAIRAYTEPDIQWWIETRRKDYYSMNAIDMAGLVNELKIRGNKAAELITTENKGYRPNGDRHPHSWSIVNEQELIAWFIKLI